MPLLRKQEHPALCTLQLQCIHLDTGQYQTLSTSVQQAITAQQNQHLWGLHVATGAMLGPPEDWPQHLALSKCHSLRQAGCIGLIGQGLDWSTGIPSQVPQPGRLPPGVRLPHSSVQLPPTQPPLSAAAGAGGRQQPPRLRPAPSAGPQPRRLPCKPGGGPGGPPAGWPEPAGSMRHAMWAAVHPWSRGARQAPCAAQGFISGPAPAS